MNLPYESRRPDPCASRGHDESSCDYQPSRRRFLGGAVNLPTARRLLLKAATRLTRIISGLSLTDTHNGLRAMTRRGASAIRLRHNRMAHASEILSQIAASGLKYVEVPVTIEYSAYSLAKGQKLGDALSILVDLSARRLHRI